MCTSLCVCVCVCVVGCLAELFCGGARREVKATVRAEGPGILYFCAGVGAEQWSRDSAVAGGVSLLVELLT